MAELSADAPPRLLQDGRVVQVWVQGRALRFHALWLRDNAQDPATRSATNGQRLITLLDIPADTRMSEAAWTSQRLSVRFEPEGKRVVYDPAWLLANAYDKPAPPAPGWSDPEIERWDGGLCTELALAAYEAVVADRGARRAWLAMIRRYGFARLTGVPRREGAACEIAALFGYVRETNYGRSFDVRATVSPTNLAYTNLGLQAHTDNPYRDPPPGLQLLVCLENTVEGGGSILVDGFKIAERLQGEAPHDFELLSHHCARFAYSGAEGVRLTAKRPLIELGADGELIAVRFNNRSAAAFTDIGFDDMDAYYAAYRRMAGLVDDPTLAVRFQLQPGEMFIVDNLRVLHAREAFTAGGTRWLQGCYADRDGLRSTLAALEEETDR